MEKVCVRHKADFPDSQGDKNPNGLPREMSGAPSAELQGNKEERQRLPRRRQPLPARRQGSDSRTPSPLQPCPFVPLSSLLLSRACFTRGKER